MLMYTLWTVFAWNKYHSMYKFRFLSNYLQTHKPRNHVLEEIKKTSQMDYQLKHKGRCDLWRILSCILDERVMRLLSIRIVFDSGQ